MSGPEYSLLLFQPDHWSTFRAIRLEALRNEPRFFGAGYEEEVKETEAQWRKTLSHQIGAHWGLFHHGTCIGLTGIWPFRKQTDTLILRASYIAPEHRGKGLSALFYRARIEWARDHGIKHLVISHREGNEASRAANQKFGFRYTHSEEKLWPDGITEGHLFYELILD
jgi:RimJ/RimL family protein N-acetyltransferase